MYVETNIIITFDRNTKIEYEKQQQQQQECEDKTTRIENKNE